MAPTAITVPAAHRCPRCRRTFDCGARDAAPAPTACGGAPGVGAAPPLRCWCAGLPPLPVEPAGGPLPAGRCLCPDCFGRALARQPAGGRAAVTE